MTELCASIFGLPEPSRKVTARNLWSEIARNLVRDFGGHYHYEDTWGYCIAVLDTLCLSPDKQLARYRTIEATIRRRPGMPTLLDLSVGNLFTPAGSVTLQAQHVVTDYRYAQWARRTGQIPLKDHVQLVKQFAEHVMDAGWALDRPQLAPFRAKPPTIRNGRGEIALPTSGFSKLAQHPTAMPPLGTEFVVVCEAAATASRAIASLQRAFQQLVPNKAGGIGLPVAYSPRLVSSAVNLLLLDDQTDLGDLLELRNRLREAESAGYRFKLAKTGSMSKPYPTLNIAYHYCPVITRTESIGCC